ncbi:sushi, von Willebrand factor type A, EGF and pentraxin domain-containing protein 1-like [Tachypleus tridentatus]|uniref:sushi, von Willebrand factor type A, EGF and pentraxin domain-containing protein 1-like n=1 Tax=Tachypleus tridentatus TaxID=6853 RepID=UPI003FD08E46
MKYKFTFPLLLLFCVLGLSSCQLDLDKELKTFLGTLETYEQTKNDVVFLLDESGSIGAPNFPHEILFAELIARLLTVSPDTSRVAVVTFSTGHKTHIDYIKNTQGNNMCTLLRDLKSIGYRGGWTHTRDALIQAGDLLKTGRSNSNRVIILISDGQSNNGDPLSIAKDLKEKGNIIFAVGVADVNKDELLAIASSPKHIYMLKDFKYIQKVNEQLRDDIKELSWDVAKDVSLCDSFCTAKSDCCDENANCFCGTRGGRYECACGAGYFGSGHRGECKMCPKGTYKRGAGSDLCKSCPSNSTTLEERSTTIGDCFLYPRVQGKPEDRGTMCSCGMC